MGYTYNCDTKGHRDMLRYATGFQKGVIPRDWEVKPYGSLKEVAVAVSDAPDVLIDPKDYKEVIQRCHDERIFPMYHQQATWAPPGFRWTQNGTNYCWIWSLTGDVMNCQAREGKRKLGDDLLAPISVGWSVGWRNVGNYLDAGVAAVIKRGIAPASFIPDPFSRSYRNYKDGWEAAAMQNRLPEDSVWDTNPRNMLQHAISILCTGSSGYIAYNWWGHALSLVGLRWDESAPNNIVWIIRNSHNEDDFLEMTGSRGVPDELLGIRATLTDLTALDLHLTTAT